MMGVSGISEAVGYVAKITEIIGVMSTCFEFQPRERKLLPGSIGGFIRRTSKHTLRFLSGQLHQRENQATLSAFTLYDRLFLVLFADMFCCALCDASVFLLT